jgi:hypothetical protein
MVARQMAVLTLLAAVGCGSHESAEDRRAFSSVDSWYSPPSADEGFSPVGKDRFAMVADTLQPEAQAALARAPAKRMSADEAARLAGKQLPAGGEYVLLRAVVLNERTGGFEVGVNARAVHVHHGCLGRHPVPMARKALIVVLPAVPEVVYASCGMAE